MNWLSNLITGLWNTPKPTPRPKEVMIMSTPTPSPRPDSLHLTTPSLKRLTVVTSTLTNSIPQPRPDLVGNNASGTIPIMLPPLVQGVRPGLISNKPTFFGILFTFLTQGAAWRR